MFIPGLLLLAVFLFQPSVQHQMSRSLPTNENCTVKHGKRLYREGEIIISEKKFFKVEDCQVQRAYRACGTPLWYMIHIVCSGVERQKAKNSGRKQERRFTQELLLTESCCEHLCTISEMTRYCPLYEK